MKKLVLFLFFIVVTGFSQNDNPSYEKIVLDYFINSSEFKQQNNYQINIEKKINSILIENYPFFYPSKFEGICLTSSFVDSIFKVNKFDLEKYSFKNVNSKNKNKIKLVVYKRYLVNDEFIVVTLVEQFKTGGKVYFFMLNLVGEILNSYSESFVI